MDKQRLQADSPHQVDLKRMLYGVLIVVGTWCTCWRNKFGGVFTSGISHIFAYNSATNGAMGEWRLRLDSARQTGQDSALEGVLIVVGSGIAGAEEVRAEFLALRLWGS
jgi:hypothetical protein